MAMDVIGNAPRSKCGEYFRRNVWWWRPLWAFCEQVASDIIPKDNLGHCNVGWGLDDSDSCGLADRLQYHLDSGDISGSKFIHMIEMECFMGELCDLANVTGERWSHGDRACRKYGKGCLRPRERCYLFCEANVRDFAAFLRDCGGFRIS
jgi:hypothetical protein